MTNSGAAFLGDDYDYVAKTMRLLGFNSVGITRSKAVKMDSIAPLQAKFEVRATGGR
jgi:hypothetical protein